MFREQLIEYIWIFRIVFMIAMAILWYVGGQWKGRIRDVGVPMIISIHHFLFSQWWYFLALNASYQIIRLGYGSYDPENDPEPSFLARITKFREGWKIRAIYAFLSSSIGALPYAIDTKCWLFYGGYVLLNVLVMAGLCKLNANVKVIDPLSGASIGSVVCF